MNVRIVVVLVEIAYARVGFFEFPIMFSHETAADPNLFLNATENSIFEKPKTSPLSKSVNQKERVSTLKRFNPPTYIYEGA